MIYEYAVDPSIAATWTQLRDGRFFKDRFGLGTPRIVSSFPHSWRKLVLGEVDQFRQYRDLEISRMVTLLDRMCHPTIRRCASNWDINKSWLENAEIEHSHTPFDAILAKSNPRSHERVICADSIDDNTPLWSRKRNYTVERDERVQELVRPMLRIATKVIFVDPYFCTDERFLQPMKRYLEVIMIERNRYWKSRSDVGSVPQIEICRSWKSRHLCESKLSAIVPRQLNLIVSTLKQRSCGESLHNRYILTDVGGLLFGHGLDDRQGTHDDLVLLDEVPYWIRWNQYANGPYVFDWVDKKYISGSARD